MMFVSAMRHISCSLDTSIARAMGSGAYKPQALKPDYAGECLYLTHERKTEEIHNFTPNRRIRSLILLIGGMY